MASETAPQHRLRNVERDGVSDGAVAEPNNIREAARGKVDVANSSEALKDSAEFEQTSGKDAGLTNDRHASRNQDESLAKKDSPDASREVTPDPIKIRPNRRRLPGENTLPLAVQQDNVAVGSPDSTLLSPRDATLTITAVSGSHNSGTFDVGDLTFSPIASASPSDFSAYRDDVPNVSWPWRSPTQRALSRSEKGSLRRAARRSTSVKSSISPASAFLSQWGRSSQLEEEPLPVAQPDSEGQEITGSGYIIGKQVGRGAFSSIKEVHGLEGGARVRHAVKITRKNVDGADDMQNEKVQGELDHEVSIWRFLKHPYILPLLSVYDSPFATFCITHLNAGGTLLDVLAANQKRKRQSSRSLSQSMTWGAASFSSLSSMSQVGIDTEQPSEEIAKDPPGLPVHLARRYLFQLASALRYLHEDVRVVHRDVKPDNCLIDMTSEESSSLGGNLLLCDFGLAEFINAEDREDGEQDADRSSSKAATEEASTVTGSVHYVSPESIETDTPSFSPAVDMWAYGVVAYSVLVGALPFSHDLRPVLMQRIKTAEYNTARLQEAVMIYGLSEEGVEEMVTGCLNSDPAQRLDISQVLSCKWFSGAEELYETKCGWLEG